MARKPSDITKPNLRIREDLRRRLELAAKKRRVSLNIEMASRLKESFERVDMLKLSKIASNIENFYERHARKIHAPFLEDLMQAVETPDSGNSDREESGGIQGARRNHFFFFFFFSRPLSSGSRRR